MDEQEKAMDEMKKAVDEQQNVLDEVQKAVDEQQNVVDGVHKVISAQRKHKNRNKYYSADLADKRMIAQSVVSNLQKYEPDRQMMLPYGYDESKIAAFAAVYQAANHACAHQQIVQAEKWEAARQFALALKHAQSETACLVKISRVALAADIEKLDKLQLNGRRGKSQAALFLFMDSLYRQILADDQILVKLAAFGYGRDKILACQQAYQSAREAAVQVTAAKAAAVQFTKEMKAAFAELDRWMSEYNALYKVALVQQELNR